MSDDTDGRSPGAPARQSMAGQAVIIAGIVAGVLILTFVVFAATLAGMDATALPLIALGVGLPVLGVALGKRTRPDGAEGRPRAQLSDGAVGFLVVLGVLSGIGGLWFPPAFAVTAVCAAGLFYQRGSR